MQIEYRKKFLKELSKLPSLYSSNIETFVFETLPNCQSLEEVGKIEKMRRKIMKTITAKEFDEKFDNSKDISEHLDFSISSKLNNFEKKMTKAKKVNVDFPENILILLDQEARRIGVTRQSIIKVWIAERLKEEQKHQLVG